MLDEKTLEWLRTRNCRDRHCYCNQCPLLFIDIDSKTGPCLKEAWCPVFKSNYRDAAEFEARVQRHLMYQYEKAVKCAEIAGGFCPSRDTMLMFARLSTEEEMEAENAR